MTYAVLCEAGFQPSVDVGDGNITILIDNTLN